jgi:CIC family chloride channel protein
MSNGYELIVPLMLSTSIAYLIARTFNKHSIFTQTLAERGEMYQYRDKAVLKQLRIKDLLEKDVIRVSVNSTLGELTGIIKRSRRNIFAIVDDQNTFIGIVSLDNVREDMFNQEKWQEPISNYLYSLMDDEKVSLSNDVQEVINKFNRTSNYNLVVLDGNKYAGMLSRANVLKAYRESMLADVGDF